jgi:hypothetical protein
MPGRIFDALQVNILTKKQYMVNVASSEGIMKLPISGAALISIWLLHSALLAAIWAGNEPQ